MKSTTSKRALSIANLFNILVAIYFFIISTVSLIKLRWYHRLTVHNKWHHFISSSSSYFAFIILLAVALLLAIVFILSISYSNTKIQMSFDHFKRSKTRLHETTRGNCARSLEERPHVAQVRHGPSFMEASSKIIQPRSWSIALQILASLGLVVTLIVWLLNGAEIARDSIEKELTPIFNRYQFFNNRDYISRLVDGIQETNNCCGLHSFTDSRVTRTSGFSSAYYPISCCDKGTYPPSAPTLRYACALEEVTRSGQMVSLDR